MPRRRLTSGIGATSAGKRSPAAMGSRSITRPVTIAGPSQYVDRRIVSTAPRNRKVSNRAHRQDSRRQWEHVRNSIRPQQCLEPWGPDALHRGASEHCNGSSRESVRRLRAPALRAPTLDHRVRDARSRRRTVRYTGRAAGSKRSLQDQNCRLAGVCDPAKGAGDQNESPTPLIAGTRAAFRFGIRLAAWSSSRLVK